MNFEIKNIGVNELDLLLQWRMEVLSRVFAKEFKSLTEEEINTIRENNRKYYLSAFEKDEHIACFVYCDGEIIGCGGICIYSEMPSPDNISGKCGYLMNIYIRDEFRKHGAGSEVVKHLVQKAKTRDITKIYLETSDFAEHMYRELGFNDMKGYMKL